MALPKPSLVNSAPPGDDEAVEGDAMESDAEAKDPGVQAAEVMISAVRDGDAEAFADALKSFCDMHASSDGPSMPGESAMPKPKLVVAIGRGNK